MSDVPNRVVDLLRTEGFALTKLTPDEAQYLTETFVVALEFFKLPAEAKNLNILTHDMGYRPSGVEFSQSEDRPDELESFTASIRFANEARRLQSEEARDLYQRMLQIIDIFETIAGAAAARLSSAFRNVSARRSLDGAFRRWSRLQLNYSRPATVKSQCINDPHEDGDFLTVACATAAGLEIQTSSGQFMPIVTAPDEVLLMPGEILWLMSGGIIRPLYHRVCPDPRCLQRMALVFFGDIHPDLCQPWIQTEVNNSVDIGARVLTNANKYGLHGFPME